MLFCLCHAPVSVHTPHTHRLLPHLPSIRYNTVGLGSFKSGLAVSKLFEANCSEKLNHFLQPLNLSNASITTTTNTGTTFASWLATVKNSLTNNQRIRPHLTQPGHTQLFSPLLLGGLLRKRDGGIVVSAKGGWSQGWVGLKIQTDTCR